MIVRERVTNSKKAYPSLQTRGRWIIILVLKIGSKIKRFNHSLKHLAGFSMKNFCANTKARGHKDIFRSFFIPPLVENKNQNV